MHTVDIPVPDYTQDGGTSPTIEVTLVVRPFINICPAKAEELLANVIARAGAVIREGLAEVDPIGLAHEVFLPSVEHVPLFPCTAAGRLLPDSSYLLDLLEPSSADLNPGQLIDGAGRVFSWTAWARYQREPAYDRSVGEVWTLGCQ
jgi:hypothetical protein